MSDLKMKSLIDFIDMDKNKNINSTWFTIKDINDDDKIEEIYKELKYINENEYENKSQIHKQGDIVLSNKNKQIDTEKKRIDLSNNSFLMNTGLIEIITAISIKDNLIIIEKLTKIKKKIKDDKKKLNKLIKKYELNIGIYENYLNYKKINKNENGDTSFDELIFENIYEISSYSENKNKKIQNNLMELENILLTLTQLVEYFHKKDKNYDEYSKVKKYEVEFKEFLPYFTNNSKQSNKTINYLKASVKSALSWKKINYKHHSIGSSIDIVNLFYAVLLSIEKKNENSLIKMSVITDKKKKIIEEINSNDLEKRFQYLDLSFIKNIFSQYTTKESLLYNINNLIRDSFSEKNINDFLINPIESRRQKKIIPFQKTIIKLDNNGNTDKQVDSQTNTLIHYINEALKDPYNRYNGEFLITLLYCIFKNVIDLLEKIINVLENIMTSENKYENDEIMFIISNMRSSVLDLNIIVYERIKSYFEIDFDKNIIDLADTSDNPKIEYNNNKKTLSGGKKIYRLMCSFDRVIKKDNLNKKKYPILISENKNIKNNKNNKKKNHIIILDRNDNNGIYTYQRLHEFLVKDGIHSIGGLTQYSKDISNISELSFNFIIKYYNNIFEKQKRAERYIRQIFKKLLTGIHKNIIFQIVKDVWFVYENTAKDIENLVFSYNINNSSKFSNFIENTGYSIKKGEAQHKIRLNNIINENVKIAINNYNDYNKNEYLARINLKHNEKMIEIIKKHYKKKTYYNELLLTFQEKTIYYQSIVNYYRLYTLSYNKIAIVDTMNFYNKYIDNMKTYESGKKKTIKKGIKILNTRIKNEIIKSNASFEEKIEDVLDNSVKKMILQSVKKIKEDYESSLKNTQNAKLIKLKIQNQIVTNNIEIKIKKAMNILYKSLRGLTIYTPFVDIENNVKLIDILDVSKNGLSDDNIIDISEYKSKNGKILVSKTKDDMNKSFFFVKMDTVDFLTKITEINKMLIFVFYFMINGDGSSYDVYTEKKDMSLDNVVKNDMISVENIKELLLQNSF
jgi:hypothetical protein